MTDLRADCARCVALCCAALPFARSADFAIDKPAGTPCPRLQPDFGCSIHADLRGAGFRGCDVYDCFGAGQRVAQQTFGDRDWRTHPELAAPMFAAFRTMRHLHELLWYLGAALTALPPDAPRPLHGALRQAQDTVEQAASTDPAALAALDVNALRGEIAPLLRQASVLVRGGRGVDRSDADLIGTDLRTADLRDADLRNARLIAADLRGADLGHADLLGADLRDADVRGADLSAALYLTRPQLSAARGDARTRIPPVLVRPTSWPQSP